MTKVVFQSILYWLTEVFWMDCQQAGILPFLWNMGQPIRNISRDELALRHQSRLAGWGHSVPKAVSVLYASLSPKRQAQFMATYRDAIILGLQMVSPYFTARTGAQGKTRLPAEASFAVALHDQAKDGSPLLHAHLAISDRVGIKGQSKTFATHKVELYQLRELFDATVSHALAHALATQWGISVSKSKGSMVLPQVPQELCRLGSLRKQQIENYLQRHQLASTPISRGYAALATRNENKASHVGRQLFQKELRQHGFQGETLLHATKQTPAHREHALELVGQAIKNLGKSQHQFTKQELLTLALETASPRLPLHHIQQAVEESMQKSRHLGLRESLNRKKQIVYSPRKPNATWESIVRRIDHLFLDRRKGRPDGTHQEGARPKAATQEQTQSQRKTDDPRWRRSVERLLRSYEVIGAVGQKGIRFAKKAIELYQEWAKPVWQVHGNGHRNMPGSVAAMVRDLQPLSRKEAHKVALQAMWKLNASMLQKIRYGEYVYQSARKAKYRIPKRALIVIRDVDSAHPQDVKFLLQKAKKAKAKVLLVDQKLTRSQLLKAARQLRPGECRRYPTPEMGR